MSLSCKISDEFLLLSAVLGVECKLASCCGRDKVLQISRNVRFTMPRGHKL